MTEDLWRKIVRGSVPAKRQEPQRKESTRKTPPFSAVFPQGSDFRKRVQAHKKIREEVLKRETEG